MGSKSRIVDSILPIIQERLRNYNIKTYIEPFCGGCNVIDKIDCQCKIGSDIDKYTIAVLKGLRDGIEPPKEVTKGLYLDVKNNPNKYSDFEVGYIGYELSFGSKWFGGYAKRDDSKHRGDIYSYKSCMKQAPHLINTEFRCCDFREYKSLKGYVIYNDIPYKNTTKYKTGNFPYEEFYDWCRKMSKNNIVLVSEYWMPDDFECIWQKQVKVTFDSNRDANNEKDLRIEKLFKYNRE